MNFAIIPCRQASTRFKDKPFKKINGIPMVRHVYRNVVECPELDGVCAAFPLNDVGIRVACESYKVPYVMTYEDHLTGTDRVYEAVRRLGIKWGIILNIQGDEPLISWSHVHEVLAMFEDLSVHVATLAYKTDGGEDVVKPRFDGTMSIFKFTRGGGDYGCVGILGMRFWALEKFAQSEQSEREKELSVEAQRFLDLGIPVRLAITSVPTIGVDRPSDIEKVEAVSAGKMHIICGSPRKNDSGYNGW
jgi:3-deoxy-manno-octulosonate cytidylyltransferase (CMP-KDO synthetase)